MLPGLPLLFFLTFIYGKPINVILFYHLILSS